jgi:hypothetical protein
MGRNGQGTGASCTPAERPAADLRVSKETDSRCGGPSSKTSSGALSDSRIRRGSRNYLLDVFRPSIFSALPSKKIAIFRASEGFNSAVRAFPRSLGPIRNLTTLLVLIVLTYTGSDVCVLIIAILP